MQSIVIQAGWPIWLLILVSIAGLAIVIERSLSLQTRRIAPPELTNQVIQMVRAQADHPEAIEKLRKSSRLDKSLLHYSVIDISQQVSDALWSRIPGVT